MNEPRAPGGVLLTYARCAARQAYRRHKQSNAIKRSRPAELVFRVWSGPSGLAVPVECCFELREGASFDAVPAVMAAIVIDALVEIAGPADRSKQAVLLLVNQLHISRVSTRDDLVQRRRPEIADAQCGVHIAARTTIDDAGGHDLDGGQQQGACSI